LEHVHGGLADTEAIEMDGGEGWSRHGGYVSVFFGGQYGNAIGHRAVQSGQVPHALQALPDQDGEQSRTAGQLAEPVPQDLAIIVAGFGFATAIDQVAPSGACHLGEAIGPITSEGGTDAGADGQLLVAALQQVLGGESAQGPVVGNRLRQVAVAGLHQHHWQVPPSDQTAAVGIGDNADHALDFARCAEFCSLHGATTIRGYGPTQSGASGQNALQYLLAIALGPGNADGDAHEIILALRGRRQPGRRNRAFCTVRDGLLTFLKGVSRDF